MISFQLGLEIVDTPGISEGGTDQTEALDEIKQLVPRCIGVVFLINSSVGHVSTQVIHIYLSFLCE